MKAAKILFRVAAASVQSARAIAEAYPLPIRQAGKLYVTTVFNRVPEVEYPVMKAFVRSKRLWWNVRDVSDRLWNGWGKREAVQIPVLITLDMKQALSAKHGLDDGAIAKLTPAEAHAILNGKEPRVEVEEEEEGAIASPLPMVVENENKDTFK